MHVESPQRRITIIKGNHDVHLIWPGVKSRLREILGASGTRASLLLFADEFVSREKIYVEHGHQRTEQFNTYTDFFNPRSSDDASQLYYPGGSRFIIDSLNEVERDHWFVDHIKPVTTLIWYTFHWNFDLAARLLTRFASQACSSADTEPPPIIQELSNPDAAGKMARRYADNPAYRYEVHQQLQQYLQVVNTDDRAEPGSLPRPEVGDNPLLMGQADQQQQQAMLRRAADVVADREGAKVIVFGHTHYPAEEHLNNGSTYINAGSWIEDFSDASPEVWERLFEGTLHLRDDSPRLSYARIDYDDDDMPTAKLMFFSQETDDVSQPETTKGFAAWLGRIFGKP
jgi:UDP-2,3-diacylglucosamine pyrophosphatase LpxH